MAKPAASFLLGHDVLWLVVALLLLLATLNSDLLSVDKIR